MVIPTNENWQCEECGLIYKDKEWALKCEAWCKENRSCNLEIIEHAIRDGQQYSD